MAAVKRLPVHNIVQIIFSDPVGSLGSLIVILKIRVLPKLVVGGRGWCCTFSLLIMNRLKKKRVCYFHIFGAFLAPKGSNYSELNYINPVYSVYTIRLLMINKDRVRHLLIL